MRHHFRWVLLSCLISFSACGDDDASPDASSNDAAAEDSSTGEVPKYRSEVYALDENWMCRSGLGDDVCGKPADATEIKPDKTLAAISAPATAAKKIDCFYVYPTVALIQGEIGRVTEYGPLDFIRAVVKQQAAMFSDACRVFAPLYHQIKISSYSDASRDTLLEEAYAEVEDAFKHYLAQDNDGRDIVFIGHSQGAHMLRRLLQRHFDGAEHAELRKQLLTALLIGPLGDVHVPMGERVGGSFKNIPLCATASERGCVLTYSSYAADKPPTAAFGVFVGGIPAGMDAGCTNPAALGGGKVKAKGTYFESTPVGVTTATMDTLRQTLGVTTYFSVYRDFYALECKQSPTGQSYLAVSVDKSSSDQRTDPIQYMSPTLAYDLVGLHAFDYAFALGDLAELIRGHADR